MITLEMYYKGRDKQYPQELTQDIIANSKITVAKANELLKAFFEANPSETPKRGVNSGWRPQAVNSSVTYAAKKSNHLIGKAIDINDDDGKLDAWLMTAAGLATLERIGLWMEHPSATPRWCHLQTVPPKSGKRIFHP